MSLSHGPLRMVSGVSHFVVGLCICSVPFLLFSAAQMQAVPLPHSPRTSCGDVSESLDEPHPAVDSSSQCSHGIASVAESNASAAAGPSSGDSCPPMLALPAPASMQAEGDSAMQLTLGQRVSLEEELGPLVVNSDGTVARISNWKQMTDRERGNVLRVLGKRNKERLDVLKEHAAPPQ